MKSESSLKLQLEFLWWVFTAIVVLAVLAPIYLKVVDYPFWSWNIAFIIIFITFCRYFFLLKHTFFARNMWIKLVLIFTALPLGLLITQGLGDFQKFLDEVGTNSLLSTLSIPEQNSLGSYIRKQMLFFGSGSWVVTILLAFRLVVSIWRVRNTDKV